MKQRKTKSGFTTVEMLCVVLILALLSAVIATGMALCNRSFIETKTRSESAILTATLDSLISDELRYATNIKIVTIDSKPNVSFNSAARGLRNVSIVIEDGMFYIQEKKTEGDTTTYKNTMLLGSGSYIENCDAKDLSITYHSDTGIFTVSYALIYKNPQKSGETRIEEESFQVKSLKN